MNEWEHLRQQIDHYGVFRKKPNDPPLPGKKPGTHYDFQFYLQRILLNRKNLTIASKLSLDKIIDLWNNQEFQLVAIENSGVPLAIGMMYQAKAWYDIDINVITAKKEPKEYGLSNWIEGIPNSKPGLLIDDMCNSKNSMLNACYACREHDIEITKTHFALVDKLEREESKHLEGDVYLNREGFDHNVKTLFNIDDFTLDYEDYQKYYYNKFGKYPIDQYEYDSVENMMVINKID